MQPPHPRANYIKKSRQKRCKKERETATAENNIIDKLNDKLSGTLDSLIDEINNTIFSNIQYNGILTTTKVISRLYALNKNYILTIFYLYKTNNLSVAEIINLYNSNFNSIKEFLLYKLSLVRNITITSVYVYYRLLSNLFNDFYDSSANPFPTEYLITYGMVRDNAEEKIGFRFNNYKQFINNYGGREIIIKNNVNELLKTVNSYNRPIRGIQTTIGPTMKNLTFMKRIDTDSLNKYLSCTVTLQPLFSLNDIRNSFINAYIASEYSCVYHNRLDKFRNLNIIKILGDSLMRNYEISNSSSRLTTGSLKNVIQTVLYDGFNILNVSTDTNGLIPNLLKNSEYLSTIKFLDKLINYLYERFNSESNFNSLEYINKAKPYVKEFYNSYNNYIAALLKVVENPTEEDEYHIFILGDNLNKLINFTLSAASSFEYHDSSELNRELNEQYYTIGGIFSRGIPFKFKEELCQLLESGVKQYLTDSSGKNIKYTLNKINSDEEKQELYNKIIEIENNIIKYADRKNDYEFQFYTAIFCMHLDNYIIWLLDESNNNEYSLNMELYGFNTFSEIVNKETEKTILNVTNLAISEYYKAIYVNSIVFNLYKNNKTVAEKFKATSINFLDYIKINVNTRPVSIPGNTIIKKPINTVKNEVFLKTNVAFKTSGNNTSIKKQVISTKNVNNSLKLATVSRRY